MTGWRAKLRSGLPYLLGVGVIIALVLAVNPSHFAFAASRFNPVYAPLVAALSFSYYLLQGIRWQPLLRAVGARIRLRDTLLLNFAGQAAGLLPAGELTRAVLVSEVAKVEVGKTTATITVQELIFTVLLIAAAVPGAFQRPVAAIGVSLALLVVLAITAILTLHKVFEKIAAVVQRVPLLRRFVPDLMQLQREIVGLLRRWDTLYWSPLSALQVAVTITMFWLVIQALDPGRVSWGTAAFAYAVAGVAGALSLGPGGLGGFEAAGVVMLIVVGVPFQIAVAATILQRVADKGLATVYGGVAYFYARRHYQLKNARIVRHGQQRNRRSSRRKSAPRQS
jgi:uncharacterized protein (TIRG00374 family)